jgi:hypothetical protein
MPRSHRAESPYEMKKRNPLERKAEGIRRNENKTLSNERPQVFVEMKK